MQTRRRHAGQSHGHDSAAQLTFDFAGRPLVPGTTALHALDMRRAVLGWLLVQNPTGVGVLVPTRIARGQADVAAFWAEPDRHRVLRPVKTLAVEIRHDREACWPDCARQQKLLPQFKELKQERAQLEAGIREHEPQLRDSDSLFNEFGSWRYGETANPGYRRCLRQLEEVEHALYRGSRFERIRRARVADRLYLAVPAGTVHADELADGWGLLEVLPNLVVNELRAAEEWECPLEGRLHLALQIAASCRSSQLFAHGIRQDGDGAPVFTPMPRRRRNPQS